MELEDLHWKEFEELMASLWESFGYNTELTSAGRDGGVDVIATKNDPYREKVLIQAKHHMAGNKIGVQTVREYSSLLHQPDVDIVVIATSGRFTSQAEIEAKKLGVKLVNKSYIKNNISSQLLNEYLNAEDGTSNCTSDTFKVKSISEIELSPSVKDHIKNYWNNLSDTRDHINFYPLEENIDFRPNHGEHLRYQYVWDCHNITFQGPVGNEGIIVDRDNIGEICDQFDLEVLQKHESGIRVGAYGDHDWDDPTNEIDLNSEATIATAFLMEIYGTAEDLEVRIERF